jgi:hypothetical protein
MNRRKFLQCLPASAGLCSVATAFPNQGASEESIPELGKVVYIAPGSIDGPGALGLAPPQGEPPLPQSKLFKGLRFTGKQRSYQEMVTADTWYPVWAADGTLLSPYADGKVVNPPGQPVIANSQWAPPEGLKDRWFRDLGIGVANGRLTLTNDRSTTTGSATLTGDDPYNLIVSPLALFRRETPRYEGYYPCANFFHQGVWYYGGYYCHRWINQHHIPLTYELGGFGGFRLSRDRGKTWEDTPHDDLRPLFPETGRCSGAMPIKMGTPHFVDFGRDLEHSPDGYAYVVGHGSYDADGICNWSSGDAVSMARVRPSPETMNDPAAWEFFAGNDAAGRPVWSRDFTRIAPLISWPGGAGCVNMTYQPALKKYFGFLCGGWADGDSGCYNLWVVESDALTGPWFTVAYLRGIGGGQPYFACLPSKFNHEDTRRLTVFYSSNWRVERPGFPSWKDKDGPAAAGGLCVAEFELL